MSERPNAYDLEGIHRHVKKARAERKAIRPPFDVDKVAEEIADEVNQAIFAYTGCGVAQLAGMNVLGIAEKHLHRAINGEGE